MRTLPIVVLGVLVCVVLAVPAAAEDEFMFVFTVETTETVELGNGATADVFVQRGFVVAKDASHRLHMANQNCYGTQVGTATAGEVAGYCTTVPTSGDGGFWASFQGDQTGGTWTVMRGAGSLQGATGGGTFAAQATTWADGKAATPFKGTIKLP
jgi:hypothetical protein